MTDEDVEPRVLHEPEANAAQGGDRRAIWLRGLWMIVLAVLFGIAETVLAVVAVIQFFWMLLAGEKNRFIADFGKDLSTWLAKVALFQTGASEEKPFPWAKWGA